MKNFTTDDLRKGLLMYEEAYKHKVPTEKFQQIEKALKIIKELAEKDDGKVRVEYEDDSVCIFVENFMFGVAPVDMGKWRELCAIIDSMDVMATVDNEVSVSFEMREVFKPA